MENRTRQVEVFVLIALTAAGVLAAVGGSVTSRNPPGNAHGWFAGSAIAFGAAVFVPLLYFGVHPLIVALDKRRVLWLTASRAGRPEPPPARTRRGRLRGPQRPAVSKSGGQTPIDRAYYGAGEEWRDVTEIVLAALHSASEGHPLELPVTNETFRGDPVPNVRKVLRVLRTTAGGAQEEQQYQEDSIAEL